MAPSALPAPTMVCSSSMKRMMLPARRTSSSTCLSFSSNSPRYLVPATMAHRSRAHTRLPSRWEGAVPSAMARASPSTMAVFPTPGSPMRAGLFLVRRDRIWITRVSSSSRPITGSSCPSAAIRVKSRAHWSSRRVSVLRSGSRGRTERVGSSSPPRKAASPWESWSRSAPCSAIRRQAAHSRSWSRPSSRCSALTAFCPRRREAAAACWMARQHLGVRPWWRDRAGTPVPTSWEMAERRERLSTPLL